MRLILGDTYYLIDKKIIILTCKDRCCAETPRIGPCEGTLYDPSLFKHGLPIILFNSLKIELASAIEREYITGKENKHFA